MTERTARLGEGDVPVLLDGRRVALRPLLGAGLALCRDKGDLDAAWRGVVEQDVDVMTRVVALGLGRGDLEVVAEEIWRTGAAELVEPLLRFIEVIAQCGCISTPEEVEELAKAKAAGEELVTSWEVYEHWVCVGMGWLGWTEAEVMASDINSVRVAHRAQMKKLTMCFGLVDRSETDGRAAPNIAARSMTPALFDALFG